MAVAVSPLHDENVSARAPGRSSGPSAVGEEDFLPVLWDPVHLAAAEFLHQTWQPFYDQVREALTIVMELEGSGQDPFREEEVAAVYVVLAKAVTAGLRMSAARRKVFLQAVASAVFHRLNPPVFSHAREFWRFLRNRDESYTAAVRASPETKALTTIIDHFLCHFGLGGSDNADLVYGLSRFLSPLLGAASQTMREQSWNVVEGG